MSPKNRNLYIENEERWIALSNIDYLTQFVKAWISFNAWYKNSYPNLSTDRKTINEIKSSNNPFRNRIESLLMGTGLEQQAFKQNVALLHQRLEGQHIYNNSGSVRRRITFTEVVTGPNPISRVGERFNRCYYEIERGPLDPTTGNRLSQKHILCILRNSNSAEILDFCRKMDTI